jgi:hypothetical protein
VQHANFFSRAREFSQACNAQIFRIRAARQIVFARARIFASVQCANVQCACAPTPTLHLLYEKAFDVRSIKIIPENARHFDVVTNKLLILIDKQGWQAILYLEG